MEILAHTLWTTAVAKKANLEAKKKNKKFKLDLLWAAFWGIFPDLFNLLIPMSLFLLGLFSGVYTFESFAATRIIVNAYDISHATYLLSHSLIIFVLVFSLVWFILKRPPWVMLGWAFHILIDIPSHSILYYSTPFLYPLSNYRFPYGVSWSNQWFMIINYLALALVWGTILFKKYKHKIIKNKTKNG